MPESLESSMSWALVRLENISPIEDAVVEISEVTGCSIEIARKNIMDVLDEYHLGISKLAPSFDRNLYSFICHVTQPYRLPHMTKRYDWYLNILKPFMDAGLVRTALDYGGGGGKESIILSKLGLDVTYCDFIHTPLTDFVRKRFSIRNLDIEIIDVRDLTDQRYDLINCLDVIEHIYDLESALCDISCRLKNDGLLFLVPTFINSWDGDHVEKNCAYMNWFHHLAEVAGLVCLGKADELTYCYQRRPRIILSVESEKKVMLKTLYLKSQEISQARALDALKNSYLNSALNDFLIDEISNNLAIYRLSSQRISQLEKSPLNMYIQLDQGGRKSKLSIKQIFINAYFKAFSNKN